MSVFDSIDAFITDVVTVTRGPAGAYSNGIWAAGAPTTTLQVPVCIQPAMNVARVIGGKDTRFDEQGEHTADVRLVFTRVELFDRESGHDPDIVTYDGADWVVFRVEPWTYAGDVAYRVTMTRQTFGAS